MHFLNENSGMRIATFFLIGGIMLSELSAEAKTLNVNIPVEKFTLENGLTVLLQPDSSIPMISYHTWYRVGSRDETPGVTGAAHMLEHMMFKGAKKYSGKEFDRNLHENGITNNAFTSWDYTGFYQNLPSHRLELMMEMEVDRMRFLKIAPEDLKSELQVVAEERRWRVDNSPMGLLREELFSQIFRNTPYAWPVIGHMKDIAAYTSEKLRYFYDRYYVPNNAVLVLAGDFDPKSTKRLIEKHYGALEKKPLEKKKYPKIEVRTKPSRSFVRKDVQNTTLMISYPTVTAHDDEMFALDILGSILGGGASSRLYSDLVYGKQLASSAGSFQLSNADSGLFGISVSVKPDQSWEKAEGAVRDQITKLLKEGVQDVELQKAKNQIMKDFVNGLQTLDGKARTLAVNEVIYGSYDRFYDDLDRYQKVTKEQVLQVAKKYLNPQAEVFVALVPTR